MPPPHCIWEPHMLETPACGGGGGQLYAAPPAPPLPPEPERPGIADMSDMCCIGCWRAPPPHQPLPP